MRILMETIPPSHSME